MLRNSIPEMGQRLEWWNSAYDLLSAIHPSDWHSVRDITLNHKMLPEISHSVLHFTKI